MRKKDVIRHYDVATMQAAGNAIVALAQGLTLEEFEADEVPVIFEFQDIAEVIMGLLCFMNRNTEEIKVGQKLDMALAEHVGEYLLNAVSAGPGEVTDLEAN